MRSDSSTSKAWSPRGDSWQQGGGRGAHQDTLPVAAGPYQPPPQVEPARYRPPPHNFSDASSTEPRSPWLSSSSSSTPSSWGDRRNSDHSGSMQHLSTLPPPPPLPPPRPLPQSPRPQAAHPAHRAYHDRSGHLEVPRDNNNNLIHGAAGLLAARIRNPPPGCEWPVLGANGSVRQEQPSGNKPRNRPRRPSEPSQPNQLPPRQLRPPIPPDHSLLAEPTSEAVENPDLFVEKYREDTEICRRAAQYINSSGMLHHMADVYQWWWSRILDRMARKEFSEITLDPHEKILRMLQDNAEKTANDLGGIREEFEFVPMTNYYAENMIPSAGFTVGQVELARRDPNRWNRRDKQQDKLFADDPTGELELWEKWRAKTTEEAKEGYKKFEEKLEKLEKRRQSESGGLPYDARSKYKKTSHQPGNRNSRRGGRGQRQERSFLTRAQFDANTRIQKGNGSPALGRTGEGGAGGGGAGGRGRGRWTMRHGRRGRA
ncbi:hypothetical protein BZA05DRAFT_83428 [Tricharina praecox]|uniref:uncharacterized protein n=1 Tax=Tricharina praecox TaxID=43433 RepID=UPI002220C9CB|nr:uncharacterized protein BZA05DRAFT_83428 [Tricharina praecox]KAI5849130.1 hypothetical protein BZA05DRAFT_83428 [Tricharina praecox]